MRGPHPAVTQTQDSPAPANDAGPAAHAELISTLFKDNNQALLNFLLTHLHNEQEAREVAQEAYVKLLQLDRPDAISFLRTYLFRIAANLAIDRLRRGTRKARIQRLDLFEQWSDHAQVEREVLASQEVALLRRAVGELKPKYRRAFALHKFCDRTVAEIAVQMGLTPRMVRSYIARSMCYCKLRLEGFDENAAMQALKELPQ
jgi:RNA polymerase sigma factor (sigma-70 family)